MNKYIEKDTKNIICLLLRMAAFIKQCKLEDKTEKDIFQISEFSFATWEFLLAIYKAE